MKRRHTILMAGMLATLLLCGALRAEGDDRRVKVRGTFLKRAELEIGGRGVLAIVIGLADKDTPVKVVVPRRNKDLLAAARRLRRGQKVVVVYVVDGGRKWAQRIEVIRGDDDEKKDIKKDKDEDKGKHEDTPLRKQVAELRHRIERMEKQLRQLTEQNAHLKRRLAELETTGKGRAAMHKDKKDRKKPGADDHGDLPDGIVGFRGMLVGTVVKKLDVGFVLKVAKIGKVWKQSKAKHPKAAIGKQLKLIIPAESKLSRRHRRTLRTLEPGDRVSVGAFHHEGDRLTIVEEFRRID